MNYRSFIPSTFVPTIGHLQAIASNKDLGFPSTLEQITYTLLLL